MKWWPAVATLCLCWGQNAAVARAQGVIELRGRVIDSLTGAPVANAVARVPALRKYTLTNESGIFRMSDVPRGIQTVVVMQMGYREARVHLDVQPGVVHTIPIILQPIQLDPIVVDNKFMDRMAEGRALALGSNARGPHGEPVMWRSWDRDQIMNSGKSEPLQFLAKGPPKISIRKCVGAIGSGVNRTSLSPDRLCIGLPFAGLPTPGYSLTGMVDPQLILNGGRLAQLTRPESGNVSGNARLGREVTPGTRTAERLAGIGDFAGQNRWRTTSTVPARVFLDDEPTSLERLRHVRIADVYRVESYGSRGEAGIRLYTQGYLRLVAFGLFRRDARAVPLETFESILESDSVTLWPQRR